MNVGSDYIHKFTEGHTSFEIMDRKIKEAQTRVKEIGTLPIHFAWSGGKEAIIVGHLISQIRNIELSTCEISWTFKKCVENIKTYHDIVRCNPNYFDSIPVEWLRKNPHVLFSNDTTVRGLTYERRQQRTVKNNTPTGYVSVFGRRRPDNCVKDYLYTTKAGVQLHPIYDWSFDDVKAYFKMYEIPVPWIYGTKFGQLIGTAPFYSLKAESVGGVGNAWKVVQNYDSKFSKKNILGVK